jgi:hypothetical protein
VILIGLASPAFALGWSLEAQPLPGLPAAVDVAVASVDGRALLALATGEDLRVVDPWTAEELYRVERPTRRVLSAELDGEPSLLLCGSEGSRSLALRSGEVLTLSTEPCEELAAGQGEAEGEALVWTGVSLVHYTLGPRGWSGAEVGATGLSSPLRMAWGDGQFSLLVVGQSSLYRLDPFGLSSLAMGAPLADLAWAAGGWWAALAEEATIRSVEGEERRLDLWPERLAAGDLDGDGQADLVAFSGSEQAARVLTLSATLRLDGLPSQARTVGDLDLDGCADLLGLDAEGGLWWARVEGCTDRADLDGDGWTVESGDCDDQDPTIHPGAFGPCEGIDRDCDGEIDRPTLVAGGLDFDGWSVEIVDMPDQAQEGGGIGLGARVEGCEVEGWLGGWSFVYDKADDDGPEELLDCEMYFDPAYQVCWIQDDGWIDLTFGLLDPVSFETLSWQHRLEVLPASGSARWDPEDGEEEEPEPGLVVLSPGESYRATFSGWAVGNDQLSAQAEGPPGLTLTLLSEGERSATWQLDLRAGSEPWAGEIVVEIWEQGQLSSTLVQAISIAETRRTELDCRGRPVGAAALLLPLIFLFRRSGKKKPPVR